MRQLKGYKCPVRIVKVYEDGFIEFEAKVRIVTDDSSAHFRRAKLSSLIEALLGSIGVKTADISEMANAEMVSLANSLLAQADQSKLQARFSDPSELLSSSEWDVREFRFSNDVEADSVIWEGEQ